MTLCCPSVDLPFQNVPSPEKNNIIGIGIVIGIGIGIGIGIEIGIGIGIGIIVIIKSSQPCFLGYATKEMSYLMTREEKEKKKEGC